MARTGYVYILASSRYGTLYTGVTSNLAGRMWQHRNHLVEGFTSTYEVSKLVWYEVHEEIYQAITREKQIKAWKRTWKINMVHAFNPQWRDLFDEIAG
ncbi:GIY-YIG nuclease family protein [Massilia sp. R2A-15]|uniref:GIY-YIG nuclease family protein n=1 Tax=Massilia sp. R2A-15 TaxID=3064278 RepID=UPI0027360A68|nr:GIY-YIG nuclease family protein [Massilia sp. R2A-15]WLI90620.1 GIY-YIG nuclease family protein [Massilia sp. R2A-15]